MRACASECVCVCCGLIHAQSAQVYVCIYIFTYICLHSIQFLHFPTPGCHLQRIGVKRRASINTKLLILPS